jgi:membrane protease YdiL (CAAX protease family)
MRAYLITRLEELVNSTALAVFLSTLLFTFYHGYEGYLAVTIIALHGLILAVAFCLFRRLAPLSLAHAAYNFFAFGGLRWI